MDYEYTLEPVHDGPHILADYPEFVEPLRADRRFLAPPLVDEPDADLTVRAWRWSYNARGIIEMENHLEGQATAIVMVHPWGIDDDHGMQSPEPAGIAFFCVPYKNRICTEHIRKVVNPFLQRLREHVRAVGYSLPGVEDDVRKQLYPSICTPPEQTQPAEGEQRLQEVLRAHDFHGGAVPEQIALDPAHPVASYLQATYHTDATDCYNGEGYWQLPMPVHEAVERGPRDLVFYDGEGYEKVRDYLQSRGIRHVLLCGYATDMCVIRTTCGWENMSRDFNLFVVGDATLACFPGSTTPRYATQVALANTALSQLVTQVNWIRVR